ncbi:MAG: ABC transporter substrate-binding protein [Actinomadura sp.]
MYLSFASLRSRRRTLPGAASAIVAAALTLSACGGSGGSTDASGRTEVKVRTDVFYTGAVLPLLAGIDKGIYNKHGLDITLNPGKGSATTIQTVGNGSDDIGYADGGALVQAAGKGVPVEMVAGMVQRSPLAVFTRADSGIQSARQLSGRTAGFTAGSAPETLFPAFAKATGLDPDSVRLNKVDIPTRDSLFVQGKAQFTFGLLNVSQANMEAKCKCKLVALGYADAGLDVLSSGIVTSKSFASEHPDTVRKFLAATAEAVDYTNKNVDAAVESFFTVAETSTLSKDVVKRQWLASADLMHTDRTKSEPFGCMATDDWASTIDLMQRHGGVAAGKVTPSGVASNAFLGQCSDPLGKK